MHIRFILNHPSIQTIRKVSNCKRSISITYRNPSINIIVHSSSNNQIHTMSSQRCNDYTNLPLSTAGPEECALTGSALLNTPYLNKGAAFPADERKKFKLTGLLPQHVSTLEQQVKRAYQQYCTRSDDLAKNTFMTSLAEQNQVLYFKVCISIHIERYEWF